MWEHMRIVVRALFPALIVLRLADSNKPNMDKLYFYVRRLDKCLEHSHELLDGFEDSLKKSQALYIKVFEEISSGLHDDGNKASNNEDKDDDSDNNSEGEIEDYMSADEDGNDESLATWFFTCWEKRREKLVHDYSISGWLTSPIPEIYEDAKENQDGVLHRNRMERLFLKLFQDEVHQADSSAWSKMLDTFWSEYEDFQSKSGKFGGREYIWNSLDLRNGDSHLWHKKYSVPYTSYFGKFACRVCSKILGIGSAERNWGHVKHLKTEKRSHLSVDRTKKQATIFGADCAERARIKKFSKKAIEDDDEFFIWDDTDFDAELGFDSEEFLNKKNSAKPKKVIRCWMEDWELEAVGTRNAVSQTMILRKYGGLQFYDIDENKMGRISSDTLVWLGKRKGKDGGWGLKGYDEEWVATDENRSDHEENWLLFDGCPIHDLLLEYYAKEKDMEIVAVTKEEDEVENEDTDEDTEDENGGNDGD